MDAAFSLVSLHYYLCHAHYTDKDRQHQQKREGSSERSQTVRVPGVRGQGEGRDPAQMCRVQGRVVLRQGPRHTAQARAREILRRADSDLRLPCVREAGSYQVRTVQGGDVLWREAHVKALVGARERVRGAARVSLDR